MPRKKKPASGTTLVLRTCAADMTAHGGFVWPCSGPVEAPDWNPRAECGNGLHGLLMGEGDGSLLDWTPDAVWLVVQVEAEVLVDLRGKVKFPRGEVVQCGPREEAIAYLMARGGRADKIQCGTASATGYQGTASATGDHGTASASGDQGTASATGYHGTASATGYHGTASATGTRGTASASGDQGTASATGDHGTASASGDQGTASATGTRGTASATGYQGTASATGYHGTASATGTRGTASASGKHGLSIAEGAVAAGDKGTICARWWDGQAGRYRYTIGYIGEDGIEPYYWYSLDDGKWQKGDPIPDSMMPVVVSR